MDGVELIVRDWPRRSILTNIPPDRIRTHNLQLTAELDLSLMKTRLIIVVLLFAGAAAVGVVRPASTIQKKPAPQKDYLKWAANEAKSKGQQKVRVAAPLIEYLGGAGGISAEQAFSYSTVVVAHLVSKQSTNSDDDITTWNKFAIDETLSEAKDLQCPGCVPRTPPATVLPVSTGEFLLPKAGGTVNIDGVEVQQFVEDYPEYELNQKYLFLIALYPAGVARTTSGPVGVFKVLPNDKLSPVSESEHKIRKDFKAVYGNSLDRVRKHLKNK